MEGVVWTNRMSNKRQNRQNGGRNSPKALRVPFPLNGADFCGEGMGHFKSSGEKIWKSIWNECKIIAWIYWPYIYAEWLSNYSTQWCVGAEETFPSHGPHGKSFNLLQFSPFPVPSCEKSVLSRKEYAICRSPRQIESNIFTCIVGRTLNAISDRNKTCFASSRKHLKKVLKTPQNWHCHITGPITYFLHFLFIRFLFDFIHIWFWIL